MFATWKYSRLQIWVSRHRLEYLHLWEDRKAGDSFFTVVLTFGRSMYRFRKSVSVFSSIVNRKECPLNFEAEKHLFALFFFAALTLTETLLLLLWCWSGSTLPQDRALRASRFILKVTVVAQASLQDAGRVVPHETFAKGHVQSRQGDRFCCRISASTSR